MAEVERLGIAVLADDLTGAHASAARLREAGCRAVVTWRLGAAPADADAVAVDMRTRDYGADPYAKARSWAGHMRALGAARIELRIDSTLRGDPAAELRGVLDGLAGDVTVLAVPAFPGAGRFVRDGRLETPGLDLPEQRRDPARLIFAGASVHRVGLDTIASGPEAVAAEIAARREAGSRFFLADAASDDDLRVLAAAAAQLDRLVTVSPGAWLAYREFPRRRGYSLVVLSSRTGTNRLQLDRLAKDHDCLVVPADEALTGRIPGPRDLGDSGRPPGPGVFPQVIVVETLSREVRDGAEAWAQSTIAAQAAARVLDRAAAAGARCDGIVCGGGQTASALMDVLGADWLETEAEAAPLCPRSRLGSGPYAGLPLITKGGLVGTETTLSMLVTGLTGAQNEGEATP